MSTRKPSPPNRSLRPAAEDLETRQLLSGVASGTDIDGDTWTLRLVGPGSLPKTSSGKLQRSLCRTRYLSAELPTL